MQPTLPRGQKEATQHERQVIDCIRKELRGPLQNCAAKGSPFSCAAWSKNLSRSQVFGQAGLFRFHARSHWFRMPSPPARLSSAPGSPGPAGSSAPGRACSQSLHCQPMPRNGVPFKMIPAPMPVPTAINTKSFAPCPMPRSFRRVRQDSHRFQSLLERQARTQALPARECRASPLDMT